ncbi:MAG: serine hydrolase domain-containing protein [Candidatus Caldatribacteriota bacterium]|nr:serine hydrolase domain-containing protein [Candidatus Caldatribacteriota bacterium]
MDVKKAVSSNLINRLWVRILVVLIISFVLVFPASKLYPTKGVETHASLEKFVDHLDERIPLLMKDYDIPGVNIAFVQKGETAWSRAYGYADLEEGRKMTIDTYCRTQSISKSVTAWGVMKLVEQGKIDLDHTVELYIKNWEFPETEFSEGKITVRQLLTHTSGMPQGVVGPSRCYSPEEDKPTLEESLSKEAIPEQEPGQSFVYSNVGFHLLELLIEEVTGRDFAEYMNEEVFIPLGMHNSTFTWSEELEPAVPVGSDLKGNPVPVYVYSEKASGGLLATAEDVATFISAGMTNFNYTDHDVLNTQNINKLYTPSTGRPGIYGLVFNSYGFGHFIETLPNGKQAVSHGGQGYGLMTHFHSAPETGDGIVILTNSQRSWPFIAYILTDWAEWSGFSSVGMSKIILGQKVIWTLIGLIWFIFLWQVWRLGQGLISGRRQFAPLSKESRLLRLVQSSLFIILMSGLLWSINQDYLFISSVFPIASSWLGFSIFLFAVVLLLSALFPCIEDKIKSIC